MRDIDTIPHNMASKKGSRTKKTVSRVKVVSKQPSLQDRVGTFFIQLRPSTKVNGNPVTNRKYFLPVIGLLVLLGLGFLASKYLVIAWVDNKPISRLSYYNQLDQKYGKDLREQLIVETLIESEAQKKGVTVTNQEVDSEIKKIADEQGGQDKLNQVLQLQGITQDELRRLVRLQLLRQKMFGQGLAISDQEVNTYYDQNKDSLVGAQTTPDASTEAKIKANVRNQLLQQKVSASFSAWLQQNLNSNRVVRVQ